MSRICTYYSLQVVPSSVWRINVDPPQQKSATFSAVDDDRWWEQVDLVKLVIAVNSISDLSEDIRLLSSLALLDVSPA